MSTLRIPPELLAPLEATATGNECRSVEIILAAAVAILECDEGPHRRAARY